MIEIRTISANDALQIRHLVLWPDKSADFCRVDGDDDATHLGRFARGRLVSVLSLFDEGETLQLRKFATLPHHQGQGHGSALMIAALDIARVQGKQIRLHARETAIPFYTRFKMVQRSAPFHKYGGTEGPAYVWMEQEERGSP